MSRILICLLFAALLQAAQQTAEPPRASDAREYELATQAASASDPEARLKSLETWRKEYPETALEPQRRRLEMQAYQSAGRIADAVAAAEKVLEIDDDDFAAEYLIASLAPAVVGTDPGAAEKGRRAAGRLLKTGIERQFETRPDGVDAARWAEMRRLVENRARLTLGWAALQSKDLGEAERELTTLLENDPNSAQASYWLATALLGQKSPEKNDAALFALARAAAYEGAGALPENDRRSVGEYLRKVYASYAGTEDGLDELLALARDQALPPEDMPRILSKPEREAAAEEERRRENPELYAFLDLREALTSERGAAMWADFRGKVSPEFALYVVAGEPAQRPLRLLLASESGGEVELVLELENRRRTPIAAGSRIVVEGVAKELATSPFQLTLNGGRVLSR